MGARRSLRLLPGIGTILLWASAAYAGGAASMKERHNQSDRQACVQMLCRSVKRLSASTSCTALASQRVAGDRHQLSTRACTPDMLTLSSLPMAASMIK